jgi:acyl carrier protein
MIADVEAHFDVKFKLKELIGMKNVGDMMDLILAKKGAP